ncbi:hypothetical protein [Stenotrophomonas panacihumi]|nr:hypothetical protein [Stenotrophomonas panacihumi]PTN53431.1 hypothetical protein C9J98_15560 [Stenotrophomonas panacihumi]
MAALLCLAFVARADWVELGAATYCSSHGKGFALLPIALTDDEATTIGAPEQPWSAGARRRTRLRGVDDFQPDN